MMSYILLTLEYDPVVIVTFTSWPQRGMCSVVTVYLFDINIHECIYVSNQIQFVILGLDTVCAIVDIK